MFSRSTPRLSKLFSTIVVENRKDFITPIFFFLDIRELKLCLIYNKSIERLIKGVL